MFGFPHPGVLRGGGRRPQRSRGPLSEQQVERPDVPGPGVCSSLAESSSRWRLWWCRPPSPRTIISAARVEVEVGPDGTVEVTEHISFDFNGSFEGAYRDIPIRTGEQVPTSSSPKVRRCSPGCADGVGFIRRSSSRSASRTSVRSCGWSGITGRATRFDFHGVIPDDGTRRRLRRRRRCLSPGMG